MNYVVLTLLGMIRRKKIFRFRTLLGAVVGAFFGTFLIVMRLHNQMLLFLFIYITGTSIILGVSFGAHSLKEWVLNIMLFYLLSFVVCGFLLALSGQTANAGVSFGTLLVGSVIILFIGYKGIPYLLRCHISLQHKFPVKITFQGKETEGIGYLDTGNQLTEPISKEPVVIVQYSFLKKILSEEEQKFIQEFPDGYIDSTNFPRIHYIPYHSVGNDKGYLLGIRVDAINIYNKRSWMEVKNPWLGLYESYLSSNGDYQMLLHEELFQN